MNTTAVKINFQKSAEHGSYIIFNMKNMWLLIDGWPHWVGQSNQLAVTKHKVKFIDKDGTTKSSDQF